MSSWFVWFIFGWVLVLGCVWFSCLFCIGRDLAFHVGILNQRQYGLMTVRASSAHGELKKHFNPIQLRVDLGEMKEFLVLLKAAWTRCRKAPSCVVCLVRQNTRGAKRLGPS